MAPQELADYLAISYRSNWSNTHTAGCLAVSCPSCAVASWPTGSGPLVCVHKGSVWTRPAHRLARQSRLARPLPHSPACADQGAGFSTQRRGSGSPAFARTPHPSPPALPPREPPRQRSISERSHCQRPARRQPPRRSPPPPSPPATSLYSRTLTVAPSPPPPPAAPVRRRRIGPPAFAARASVARPSAPPASGKQRRRRSRRRCVLGHARARRWHADACAGPQGGSRAAGVGATVGAWPPARLVSNRREAAQERAAPTPLAPSCPSHYPSQRFKGRFKSAIQSKREGPRQAGGAKASGRGQGKREGSMLP